MNAYFKSSYPRAGPGSTHLTGRKTQFTYELQERQRQQGLAGIGSRDLQVRYAERRVQVCPLFFDVLKVDNHFRFLSAAG